MLITKCFEKRLCASLIVWLLVPAVYDSRLLAQQGGLPRFTDFPVKIWRGKALSLNRSSHPLARIYPTRLREDMQTEGINFAGHYTFATVGCGTGCSVNAIIDVRTGRAFFPKQLNGWTSIVGDFDPPEEYEQQTRADSRLLRRGPTQSRQAGS